MSCDVHTCVEEAIRATQAAVIDVADELPKTTVAVDVELLQVLDLTDGEIRQAVGISHSVLTRTDWKSIQANGEEAITQVIGRLVKEAGFEAMLVPSSVWKHGRNLDIFPDNLLPSSEVSIVNKQELL